MSGVADTGKCAERQIIKDEGAQAPEHFAVDLEIRGRLFQFDKGNEHAGEPEDGSGRAGARSLGMPIHAGDAAEDAAREISQQVGEAAQESLGGAAKIPQAPHVEAQVNYAEVHKHAGDEAPPLSAKREWAEVGAEGDGLLWSRINRGYSAEHHD